MPVGVDFKGKERKKGVEGLIQSQQKAISHIHRSRQERERDEFKTLFGYIVLVRPAAALATAD